MKCQPYPKRDPDQNFSPCNTIGEVVKMSANTVRKYVMEPGDRQFIRTELNSTS